MKTLEEIKQVLSSHKSELRQKYKVKELGIFGSFVRGEQTETSDLDLLVDFEGTIGLIKFLDLEEYLSQLLETKVDLVTRKALKPHIGQFILSETILV